MTQAQSCQHDEIGCYQNQSLLHVDGRHRSAASVSVYRVAISSILAQAG